MYVFSYFPFGFEGRIWDLIVSVPDHCLSFYFSKINDKKNNHNNNDNDIMWPLVNEDVCTCMFLAMIMSPYRKIREMTEKLRQKPQDQLLKHYDRNNGEDAASKLIGELFKSSLHEVKVTEGQKNRSSIRIPTNVVLDGKGYFEERRVAADADPYEVSRVFVEILLLDK